MILLVTAFAVLMGLENQDPDVQERIDRLKSKKVAQRLDDLRALSGAKDPTDSDLAFLVAFLEDDQDQEVRQTAADVLSGLESKAAPAVNQLLALTQEPDLGAVLPIEVLGNIGVAHRDVLEQLKALALGENQELAKAAVMALIELGSDAIPALAGLVEVESPSRQTLLAQAWRLGAKSLEITQKALDHPNEDVLAQGISAFGDLEVDDPDQDESLLQYLKHTNPKVRSAAAEAIGDRVLVSPRFIKALEARAGDQSEVLALRVVALGALEKLGRDAYIALPTVKTIFKEESDRSLRLAAWRAWDEMGVESNQRHAALCQWMQTKRLDIETRIELADLLGDEVPEEAFAWVLDMVRSKDERLREKCCWALLTGYYHNQAEARQVVLPLTRDRNDAVRTAAVAALRYDTTEKTRKAQRRALRDKNVDVRCQAIWGLGNGTENPSELAKWIRPCLKDKLVRVRLVATVELLQAGVNLKEFEEIILEGLDQDRSWSFAAIDRMTEVPDSILEKLRRLAKTGSKRERLAVLKRLCRHGTLSDREESLPYLRRRLDDLDYYCRIEALTIVAKFDENEIPKLFVDASKDRSWRVRWRVANSVSQVGGPKCLEILTSAVTDPQPWVRSAAIDSLCEVAPTDGEVMRIVIDAFEDSSPLVRYSAARSCGELDKSMSEVDEALRRVMKDDPHEGVVDYARYSLGRRTGDWR